jgi:hypothetical protein
MRRRIATSSLATLAALLCAAGAAQAQINLTGLTPYTQDFDTFVGTLATVPTGWTTGGSALFIGTLTSGSSAYNQNNGWYSLNDNGSTADRAIGGRVPAGSTFTLTAQFVNQTGQALSGFNLAYAVEQYTGSDPATTNTIDLTWSTNGTTFVSTGLTGDLTTASTNGSPDTVFADPLVTARVAALTGQTIAPGASFYVRYSFIPAGGGSRPIWGVDAFSLTPTAAAAAVPEASPLGLMAFGSAGAALLGLTRRLRRR